MDEMRWSETCGLQPSHQSRGRFTGNIDEAYARVLVAEMLDQARADAAAAAGYKDAAVLETGINCGIFDLAVHRKLFSRHRAGVKSDIISQSAAVALFPDIRKSALQVVLLDRLAQQRRRVETRVKHLRMITCHKDKRHFAVDELLGQWIDQLAIEIDIENRGIE